MSQPVPLILDVDTGTDDALALAYAIQSPHIDLIAVTTVAGNVSVEKTTANSLAVLDWLGADSVPVHRGASRPLVRPHRDAIYFHDEGGLGGARLPASRRAVGADRGPAAIIRLALQRPREMTLVMLGPLTNLAIALNVEPSLVDVLKEVVVMGGAYRVPGNTTPAAEFNILVDPEAAEQVFSAPFRDLTVVGLDVTQQVALTRDDWDAVNCDSSLPPPAALLREIGAFAFSTLAQDRFSLHDPLSVAVAIDRSLIETESAMIEVEFEEPERGKTRIVGPGLVHVATTVEAERALDIFRSTLGLPTPGHSQFKIAAV